VELLSLTDDFPDFCDKIESRRSFSFILHYTEPSQQGGDRSIYWRDALSNAASLREFVEQLSGRQNFKEILTG